MSAPSDRAGAALPELPDSFQRHACGELFEQDGAAEMGHLGMVPAVGSDHDRFAFERGRVVQRVDQVV
jgi:hypothetical protein